MPSSPRPESAPADQLADPDEQPRYGRLLDVGPLTAFAPKPTGVDLLGTVDRALAILAAHYVHLPLKRAMYAVDPEAALQRLRRDLVASLASDDVEPLSERAFHNRMLAIFASFRDLHTTYVLPEPWRSRVAFLPLLIEAAHDTPWSGEEADARAARRYLVTKAGHGAGALVPGTEVTHVSGVPIAVAVARSAERHAGGGNADARHARGLERLTYRWLGGAPLPDEDWVLLTTVGPEGPLDVRLEWLVGALPEPFDPPEEVDAPQLTAGALHLGLDPAARAVRRVKRHVLAPGPRVPPEQDGVLLRPFPDPVTGPYAHLRLHHFDVPDVDAWLAWVAHLLAGAPQDGLLVDVRGNPGGDIAAGERLLQLFTPGRITPARLHFRATSQALGLARALRAHGEAIPEAAIDSIAEALASGAPFSRGTSLLGDDAVNDLGQQYQGPVLAVIDGLTYSTGDLFAAGVADHPRGHVLGTDGRTGAGGANAMDAATLALLLPGEAGLAGPDGAPSFQLAVRRSTRVGAMADVVLEDFGVRADLRHLLTRDDVLEGNRDLLAAAAAHFAALGPGPRLRATVDPTAGHVALEATGLARVDAHADGRPWDSIDPAVAPHVRLPPAGTERLDLLGYADGAGHELMVSARVALSP